MTVTFNFSNPATTNPTTTTTTGGGFTFGGSDTGGTATTNTGFSFGGSGSGSGNTGGTDPTTTTTTSNTGFSFSAPTATSTATTAAPSTSGFGFNLPTATSTTSTTGTGATTENPSTSLFSTTGTTGATTTTTSTGDSSSGGGGGSNTANTTTTPLIASTANDGVSGPALLNIQLRYDKTSRLCQFHKFFYTVVSNVEQQRALFLALKQQYADAITDKEWSDAFERAPQELMVPVPIRSFEELNQRMELQNKRREELRKVMERLRADKYQFERTDMELLRSMEEIRAKHRATSKLILKLMKTVEVQMQHGVGVRREDSEMDQRVKWLNTALHKPDQFMGRINELKPKIESYMDRSNRMMSQNQTMALLSDPDSLQSILHFLQMQSQGVGELLQVLKKDQDDLRKMIDRLKITDRSY